MFILVHVASHKAFATSGVLLEVLILSENIKGVYADLFRQKPFQDQCTHKRISPYMIF